MVNGRLLLIRHAPRIDDGRLAGRRDVAAVLGGADIARTISALRARLATAEPFSVLSSPARRCRETAEALWPGRDTPTDPRLWEQDFGDWEGRPATDLPDLGPLVRAQLALHRPPGGESFADLYARTAPALIAAAGAGGATAIVAHAGTVRAALALALDSPAAALAFEVAPLSLTELRAGPQGWSITCVNWRA